MYHLLTATTLFSLLTPILASPIHLSGLVGTLFPRADPHGTCEHWAYSPREEDYNAGVEKFCDGFNSTAENPNPTISVNRDAPFIANITLPSWNGAHTFEYTYRIRCLNKNGYKTYAAANIDKNTCVRKMKEILSEGKLGGEYCVMRDSETVLFKSGTVLDEDKKGNGVLVYQAYFSLRDDYDFSVFGTSTYVPLAKPKKKA